MKKNAFVGFYHRDARYYAIVSHNTSVPVIGLMEMAIGTMIGTLTSHASWAWLTKISRFLAMKSDLLPLVLLVPHSMNGYWRNPDVRLSVCLSVCDAVHSGSQGWCTGLKAVAYKRVPSRHGPICPFRYFCCRIYRLAIKRILQKKRSGKRRKCLYGLRLTRLSKRHGSFCNQWHTHLAVIFARCTARSGVFRWSV